MTVTEIILLITEIIGTAAFAVSGALVAIDRGLDAFGVVFVGCTTSFGGGLIRDLMMGNIPPLVFLNKKMLLLSILVSLLVFVVFYITHGLNKVVRLKFEKINNVFDAIGLAAVTVIGTDVVCNSPNGTNFVFAVCCGTITGVGGGMLRDVMTNSIPYIFRKHIYALTSIGGSIIYYLLYMSDVDLMISVFLSMAFTFTMRMLATHYKWSIVKIKNINT